MTANNLYSFFVGGQTIAPNQPLDLGTTNIQNGTAITQTSPTTISLAANQTYQVAYSVQAYANSAGNAQVGLGLNGTPIPGSGAALGAATPGTVETLANTVLVSTTMLSTLTLSNFGLNPQTTSYNTNTVSVVKIQ